MTRVFCDRCGAQTSYPEAGQITVSALYGGPAENRDLCQTCSRALRAFLADGGGSDPATVTRSAHLGPYPADR